MKLIKNQIRMTKIDHNDFFVGVDIGGTNVRVIIADENNLLVKITADTCKTGPIDALPTQVIEMIEKAVNTLGIQKNQIKCIGTSSAGPFVERKSLKSPNICGQGNDWDIIPYIELLKSHFGDDVHYELANDCVSSVKAEHLFGAGRGYNDCVYITISTGVGTGVVSDGHLIEGKGGNAGHFGHTVVEKDGPLCGCGQYGCIEAFVSGTAIAQRAKHAGLRINAKTDYTAKEVCELYRDGNTIAREIIDQTIQYLGLLFINIINATDTKLLIVGGSVFLKDGALFKKPVEEYIANNSMRPLSEGVKVVYPELGEYVGDIAGLSMVLPDKIIEQWQNQRPWEKGIRIELDF